LAWSGPRSKWLRKALIEAGQAAGRTKDTYPGAQYAQIRTRRGPQRAAVAVGHSILVIAWHLLTAGEPYQDLSGDYFDKRRNSAARQRRLVAALEAMGHTVTLGPAAKPCPTQPTSGLRPEQQLRRCNPTRPNRRRRK